MSAYSDEYNNFFAVLPFDICKISLTFLKLFDLEKIFDLENTFDLKIRFDLEIYIYIDLENIFDLDVLTLTSRVHAAERLAEFLRLNLARGSQLPAPFQNQN